MTNKKSQPKNPVLAAVLNVLIPGIGYLYVGVRTKFAIMLIAASIVGIAATFDPQSFMYFGGETPPKMSLIDSLSLLIVTVAFAYDAYMEAKATQK
ncbi:MAG: hypothetical protein JWM07_631 [Candidatus Saccharibacteria bacterium]|jgi:hypothetical protein|nr:hypothetical protein [Candidatus Saccharibacteria bacterium]